MALGCLLAGCGGQGRDVPSDAETGKHATVAPEGTVPVQMLLGVGTPTDSDANRHPDTIPVIAYLFPEESVSKLPVWADGEFRFLLRHMDGTEIGRWTYPPEVAETARRRLRPGPGYSFILRLGAGRDQIPPTAAELWGEFVTPEGRRARMSAPTVIRLGG